MKMNRNEVLEWLESIQENYAMQDETQEVTQALLQAIADVKAMDKLEQIVKSTTTRIVYERKFEEVKQIVNNAMQKEEEPEEVEVTSCVDLSSLSLSSQVWCSWWR